MLSTYLAALRSDERGQGLVEYALIIALVSILLIGSLTALQGDIAAVFTTITGAF
jgi:pilus assembly protein Flp/PilA